MLETKKKRLSRPFFMITKLLKFEIVTSVLSLQGIECVQK